MHGSLEPEEHVMEKSLIEDIARAINNLGWTTEEDIAIEIGGTSVYEIDGAGTKWAPVKGTRKYNKDAFIVIKNRSVILQYLLFQILNLRHIILRLRRN